MIEFRKTVIRLLIRFLLAGMATWYGRYLIVTAETEVMDISRLFAAMLCFVVAALVVAPQLLSFVVDVTGGVFGGGFGGEPVKRKRWSSLRRSLTSIRRRSRPTWRCSPLP